MAESLTLTFGEAETYLELYFTPTKSPELIPPRVRDLISASLRLQQGALDLTFSFACHGYDLAEFAKQLESLHARYDGTAQFGSGLEIQLEFILVNRARGIIEIEARLEHHVIYPRDYVARQHHQAKVRELIFRGFTIEQSYLPQIIAQIREFIVEEGISTRDPIIYDEKKSVKTVHTLMPIEIGDKVDLYYSSGEIFGEFRIVEFKNGSGMGKFTPAPGYERVRHLFSEYNQLIDDQVFLLADEAYRKISALGIWAQFGGEKFQIDDIQIYNHGYGSFRFVA
jgi:hypothetical protein